MAQEPDPPDELALVAQIVADHVRRNTVKVGELPELIRRIYRVLIASDNLAERPDPEPSPESAFTLTSQIVAAHVGNNTVDVGELPDLIRWTYGALTASESMAECPDLEFALRLTSEIVAAHVRHNTVEVGEVPELIRRVFGTFRPPPMYDEPPSEGSDVSRLHAVMLARIAALEEALQRVIGPGLGHNHPPEPIEAEPLAFTDYNSVDGAIAVVKAQPVRPSEAPTQAVEAASKFVAAGSKITSFFKGRGEVLASEAIKEAGKEFGKFALGLSIWGVLANALVHAGEAVLAWVRSLGFPL